MQDNAPYRLHVGFSGGCLIEWPPCSRDLNLIENLRSILKRRVYQDGRQFSSRVALYDDIVDAAHSRTQKDIKGYLSMEGYCMLQIITSNIRSCMIS